MIKEKPKAGLRLLGYWEFSIGYWILIILPWKKYPLDASGDSDYDAIGPEGRVMDWIVSD
ncbi:hypothetical protein ACFL6U_31890 [Planctomycetota bacterium]